MQALKLCDDLHGGPPTPLPESDAPSPANPQVRRGMGKLELSVKLPRPANGMFGRFGATMKVLDYQGESDFVVCISTLPLVLAGRILMFGGSPIW